MTKNITAILKEATKDLLTEQTLNEIKVTFDAAVNERVKIHVEKALTEQDEDYSGKLEKLLQSIDADHTNKLVRVVEAIDTSHATKLMKIVSLYEKTITRDATAFKDNLVNTIDKYLALYLDEKIPKKMVQEAVENTKAVELIKEMRTLLGVDMAMATESIREAVLDGKNIITEYEKSLKDLQGSYNRLSENHKQISSDLVLEKVSSPLPENKKAYVKRMMQGKDAEYIKENTDYVLGLFDKKEDERFEMLKEQAINNTEGIRVDRPVNEDVEEPMTRENTYNLYLEELKKF